MASTRDDEKFVKAWKGRITLAEKAKETWENDYEIPRCKRYWKGDQLDDPTDEFGNRRVQINRVHPTVRANLPSLYFSNPFARVEARPALTDTPQPKPGMSLDEKAKLLQDLGNTFINDETVGFEESTHLALKEAHWSFGCVRVMYDAEPVDNPNIIAPPMKEDEDTVGETSGSKRYGDVLGLNEKYLIKEERFYVKRIPSKQVLFSADQSGIIQENPWVGYWSISYLEDVKNSKAYKNTKDLKASGVKTGEDGGGQDTKSAAEKVKLFNIWDLRTKTALVFADGHDKVLRETKFKRLPLKFFMFDVDPDSAYPIPPIFHQLHPQDEFNHSREWLRLNRNGMVPRYTYDEEAVEPHEMRKLESGQMGTYIKRRQGTHDVIEPVSQPNYSMVAAQTLQMSKEEFNELSMSSGEKRGSPQSKTATQAKIMDVRSQVQESYSRIMVAKWLASIVEELILLAIEKMTQNKVIMLNADINAGGFPMEAIRISEMWQEISRDNLQNAAESMNWKVTIEAGSMSPVAEDEERKVWLQALSLLGNPILVKLMSASPEIRKKTLGLYGMKSARDQELIGNALALMVQMEQMQIMAGAGKSPGLASQPGSPKGLGGGTGGNTPDEGGQQRSEVGAPIGPSSGTRQVRPTPNMSVGAAKIGAVQ